LKEGARLRAFGLSFEAQREKRKKEEVGELHVFIDVIMSGLPEKE